MASKKMKKKQRITAYEDNFVLFDLSLYLKFELNVLVMCLYIENKDKFEKYYLFCSSTLLLLSYLLRNVN